MVLAGKKSEFVSLLLIWIYNSSNKLQGNKKNDSFLSRCHKHNMARVETQDFEVSNLRAKVAKKLHHWKMQEAKTLKQYQIDR